jgi:hypothetical protein
LADYDDTWKDLRWLDALVYDGTVGAGKVAIGDVLKFNKTTNRYLIRFDDGRVVSMEEEEVQRKVLRTKEISISEEEGILGRWKSGRKKPRSNEEASILENL